MHDLVRDLDYRRTILKKSGAFTNAMNRPISDVVKILNQLMANLIRQISRDNTPKNGIVIGCLLQATKNTWS